MNQIDLPSQDHFNVSYPILPSYELARMTNKYLYVQSTLTYNLHNLF